MLQYKTEQSFSTALSLVFALISPHSEEYQFGMFQTQVSMIRLASGGSSGCI